MNDKNSKLYIAETVPSCFPKNSQTFPNIGQTLLEYIKSSIKSIDISSIYTSLLNNTGKKCDSDKIGISIYEELINAAKRGVRIRILLTKSEHFDQSEAENLQKICPEKIVVGFLDIKNLTKSNNGIQHSKIFIFDEKIFYIGSANCDWRSYSEVNLIINRWLRLVYSVKILR